ncbi:MAG TPA: PLP-dependent aspartate aminotransferase family protein [Caldisericia bacterium]|nr:PLP-dependent aspartate aminotransferase family protein [Caldisericia bacterium]HPF48851.1 PLP-dependent aspartate aminotransferase family protein [Caldisericia bacterium]HPI83285.1 PLP-dependent aspartate aminotransferase family protein [Caldisericia bacterium]HPQ92512.1 PLP-dependent aspartate aminotransferase family protein [Caldisericia bacterium]HRV74390.1 PLP-dependent aspartate aminotransferase family protein [Caldisericia bacterium]
MGKHFSTRAIHDGDKPEENNGAFVGHIAPSSVYELPKLETPSDSFGEFIYSRLGTPTRNSLEKKLASIENGEAAIALSSGMAAISCAILSNANSGDVIVCQNDVYGGTYEFLTQIAPRYNIETVFAGREKLYDLSWVSDKTKLVWIETPSNPFLRITDIRKVVNSAHQHELKVIADNTFASPYLQNPLTLGVDIVVHSMTKYLGGHSDVLGGAVVSNKENVEKSYEMMTNLGCPLDPFSCFLVSRGIKTLVIRMRRAQSNATKIARFLSEHNKVSKVYYPGLYDNTDRMLALEQMRGFGAIVTFSLKNGFEAARDFFNSLELIVRAGSLGGVESSVCLPIMTSHHALSDSHKKSIGLDESVIRLSVGIEDELDLLEDISQALDKIS